jgi:hypothetical protein
MMQVEIEQLISDLSVDDGRSWRAFSDRVMGGISREQAAFTVIDGRRCVRLQGEVRLENNGGFIQVAADLTTRGQPLDARRFSGVRLLARGNGEEYQVHLRTRDTGRPWQYYYAVFTARPAWQTIDLPFSAFRPESINRELDRGSLTTLGIVGYGRRFLADIAVARVALYGSRPATQPH